MIHLCVYKNNQIEMNVPPEEISELLPEKDILIWLDLEHPTDEELDLLRDEFGFHPLAIEDLQNRQRPKVDLYPGYFFVVFYALHYTADGELPANAAEAANGAADCTEPGTATGDAPPGATTPSTQALVPPVPSFDCYRLHASEVNIFIGKNYLVTVHSHAVMPLIETRRRWRKQPSMAGNSGMLLYTILDSIVDDYFPIMDTLEDRIEEVEDKLFLKFDQSLLQSILTLKKDLLALRRVVSPEREAVNMLLRREEPILSPDIYVFMSDVYDHILRVVDMADTYRDLLSSTMDGYLSITSNNLNTVMKVLTGTSIILMSLSLITGIYGMNFVNIPELHLEYGYYMALGFMALLATILFLIFRRIGWL